MSARFRASSGGVGWFCMITENRILELGFPDLFFVLGCIISVRIIHQENVSSQKPWNAKKLLRLQQLPHLPLVAYLSFNALTEVVIRVTSYLVEILNCFITLGDSLVLELIVIPYLKELL